MATLPIIVDAARAQQGARQASQALGRVSREADRAGQSSLRASRQFRSTGNALSTLARQFGPVLAGFAAFAQLRESVRVVANLEEQLAVLQGVLNIPDRTSEQFERLTDTVRNLGATTRFTATEAAEGLTFLSRAGFDANRAIAALPATLNLASAGQIELGESADFASNIVSQFSLAAEETSRVVDTLVNTANSANTNVRQLADALKFAGPIAGVVGNSVEETAAALGVLGDRGIQASLAGTNLRGILSALLSPSEGAGDALKRLGITLAELDPNTRSISDIFDVFADRNLDAAAAVDIFGRRNAGAALILAESTERVRELTEANRESAGVAERNAALIEDTLAGSFRSLRSAVEEARIQLLGDSGFAGGLRQVIDVTTDVIRILNGFEDELKVLDSDAVATVDTIVAAFNVLSNNTRILLTLIVDSFRRAFQIFGEDGTRTFNFLSQEWSALVSFLEESFGVSFEEIGDTARRVINFVIGLVRSFADIAGIAFRRVFEGLFALEELDFSSFRAFADSVGRIGDRVGRAFDISSAVSEGIDAANRNLETDFVGAAFDLGREAGNEIVSGLSATFDALTPGDISFAGLFDFSGFESQFVAELERIRGDRVQRTLEGIAQDASEAITVAAEAAGMLADEIERGNMSLEEQTSRFDQITAKLNEQLAVVGLTREEEERRRIIQEATQQGASDGQLDAINAQLDELERLEGIQQLADDLSSSLLEAGTALATGGDPSQVIDDLRNSLARAVLQALVLQPLLNAISGSASAGTGIAGLLGGIFGRGAAFSGGNVLPFQRGEVFGGPAVRPMSGGRTGLLGEEGPEAALPLTRLPNGNLGVETSGGGGGGSGVNIGQVNINGVTNFDSFRRSARQTNQTLVRSFNNPLATG